MHVPQFVQRTLLIIILAGFGVTGFQSPALGATFTVNSTIDAVDNNPGDGNCDDGAGNCTLRAAVMEINSLGENSNVINLEAQTYPLTLDPATTSSESSFSVDDSKGDLDITANVNILGEGADQTIIEANYDNNSEARVLHIPSSDNSNTVALFNLTVRNGSEPTSITGDGCGGGILVGFGQDLALNRVTVTQNSGDAGGGIYHSGGQGSLLVNDSTISNNHATGFSVCGPFGGGGVYNASFATFINSTISGNTTNGHGGGFFNSFGSGSFRNVTISDNTADLDDNNFGNGGGIYDTSPNTIILRNTIVAGNFDNSTTVNQETFTNLQAQVAGPTVHPDCSQSGGNIISEDYNLIGEETGCENAASWNLSTDLVGTSAAPINPGLDPLADNGGTTQTHAVQTTSPALDGGDPSGCTADSDFVTPLMADQRGEPRPVDGDENGSARCDIGAFELQPPACGDGNVDAGEECDDGNTTDNDGCSSSCVVEVCGVECDPPDESTAPLCGDNTLQSGEECDDGNTASGDGCDANCNSECGNGTVDGNEECDDSNTAGGDGCSATCTNENLPFVLIGKGGCNLGPALAGGLSGNLLWLLLPLAGLAWRRPRD